MLFELSKDKSLLTILSKADLDDSTKKLVKKGANPTEIKKSLLENIDSTNLISYRKYIKKAEEEEETLRQKEERKTTDANRKKLLELLAEKDKTSVEEVDASLIRELTNELRTARDIGVDEDADELARQRREQVKLVTDKDRQKKLEAAEASKDKKLASDRKRAQRDLKKASRRFSRETRLCCFKRKS